MMIQTSDSGSRIRPSNDRPIVKGMINWGHMTMDRLFSSAPWIICSVLVLSYAFSAMADGAVTTQSSKFRRFYHSGDGVIRLVGEKNGKRFHGRYRDRDGRYDDEAYKAVSAVFGAPYLGQRRALSLRLIEFLDLLEDRLGPGAVLTLTSGYRPPAYNTQLRKKGALAAKASLHQYGMAVDFVMEGVPAKKIWDYVRTLGFGGTGYYHGRTVHVDVGPARYWDETSSGVGSGLSDDNKLIGVITDYDIYDPGEMITLSFIRMTAFPIKVRGEFSLAPDGGGVNGPGVVNFTPDSGSPVVGPCLQFNNIEEMAALRWRLPADLPPGRYRVRVGFCSPIWEQMPGEVATPEFEIREQ